MTQHGKVNIGSTIMFGNYDWRVLDINGDKALVITQNIIEERAYNVKWDDVTWETCSLRSYLNGVFYDSFIEEDKAKIIEIKVRNERNPHYQTNCGNDTNDKIFLLNIQEAEILFKNDEEREATFDDEVGSWWLRSTGEVGTAAAFVASGDIRGDGFLVNDDSMGLRPVLWLNLYC